MKSSVRNSILAAAASVALVGCGSSGGADPVAEATPGEAALTGTAVKGVLSQAEVYACLASSEACLNASRQALSNGNVPGLLGSDETDNDGDYNIELGSSANGQPVIVRLFATEATTMECDFTGCDANAGAYNGMELSTLTFVDQPASGGKSSVSAPVTALTTVAAEAARELVGTIPEGTVRKATVVNAQKQASKAVAKMLGVEDADDVNIFNIPVKSATTTNIASAGEANDGEKTVAKKTVQSLTLANASLGAFVAKQEQKNLTTVTETVKRVVKTTVVDKSTVSDEDTNTVAQVAAEINKEVRTKIAEVKQQNPSAVEATEPEEKTVEQIAEAVKEAVEEVKATVTQVTLEKAPETGAEGSSDS